MPRQHTPSFGALLKTLRGAAGLTQEALAERAGLSVRGLQDLERGHSRRPRRDTVELLAAALGLSGADRATLVAAAQARPSETDQAVAAPPPPLAAPMVPLIGRAHELDMLQRFLGGAPDPVGSAPVLLLAGEPGMGKTRLLQAAAQRAIGQGWCVLAGGCRRRGGQEPYAPLLDALAQYLHAAGPTLRRAILTGCAWLVRLLPEFAAELEPLPAETLAPEQERRLLYAAVARFLTNVAGPAGTLLVLDDLQWAGVDSLDLLAALLRTSTPLRIVGAYRDTEVQAADPLGLLLADLAQARLVRQHTLGPLALAEAAALLDHLLIDLAAAERGEAAGALQRAGGVPFFLVSYAQALHQGSGAAVPWDLAQGVRQRLALLPASGQEIAGAAAVLGRHASLDLLVAVTGQPMEVVLAGVEAACRARLLLEEGDAAYVFAHDLIREVVEADTGTARRVVLHRKVAEALERTRGVSPEVLAYHYAGGGDADKAVSYLEQAADHAWTQHAYAAAVDHYREVPARLEQLGRMQDARRVREKLGEVLNRTGHYEAAQEVLEPAGEGYRAAGDWEGLGRIAVGIAEAYARRGAVHEGIARLQPLLEELECIGAPALLAALYLWWGGFLSTACRYSEALAALERAVELARARDDGRTLVRAAATRADILQRMGQLEGALRAYHEVLPLAEALGDQESLLPAHRDLAHIHALQGAFGVGRRHGDRALALAERLENPPNRAFTLALRGWIVTLAGDWRNAQADLDLALALSRQLDRSWYSPYVLTFRARLSLAEGDWAIAAAALEEAGALAEGSGDLQALRWAAGTLAEIEILEGRPAAARARLLPLLDRPGLQECDVTMLLPVLAWAQLELDQVDDAAATVKWALGRARPEGMRLVLVEALRVQVLVALRRGHWEAATHGLEEGLALARDMPYPYAEARLLRLDAEVRARLEEPAAARERLEAAGAGFARLGARRDAAQLDQALAGLSQTPAPSQYAAPSVAPCLSAAQWAAIAALLPRPARMGRPRADDRRVLEAILYQRCTGCAWAKLPAALGDGATAHRRRQEWQAAGLWERIAAIVEAPSAAPAEPLAAPRHQDE
jgi:transcriptional regulator with XRE-family HTH domain/tetratricopeptide (TPR) repeat protein